jgi:hypothetical protein
VFSRADSNGDGYLDNDEWKASAKGSSKPQPQSMPSDSTTPTEPTDSASTPPPDTETPRQ